MDLMSVTRSTLRRIPAIEYASMHSRLSGRSPRLGTVTFSNFNAPNLSFPKNKIDPVTVVRPTAQSVLAPFPIVIHIVADRQPQRRDGTYRGASSIFSLSKPQLLPPRTSKIKSSTFR